MFRKVYRFRMYPTKEQEKSLLNMAGARRAIWNWGLEKNKNYCAQRQTYIRFEQLCKDLTDLKKQDEWLWLQEVNVSMLQQSLRDLEKAFKNFFGGRAGFPKFRSRKTDNPRFRIPDYVKVENKKVRISKVGWVKIRQHRSINHPIKSATFKRDCCDHWYVSLVVEFDLPKQPLLLPSSFTGIDAGLKDFIVQSNGRKIEAPKFFRKSSLRLRKANKSLSRCAIGSRRRLKAKLKVARIHKKISNQRREFLHTLSSSIVKEFDAIVIENLNLNGLARTKLAKSFKDASHGEFRRQLEYKCLWNHKYLLKVDRYFPSSKMCNKCGNINHKLALSDRSWVCEKCNTPLDRDLNAALNIEKEGRRMLAVIHTDNQNARGGVVSPLSSEAHTKESSIGAG